MQSDELDDAMKAKIRETLKGIPRKPKIEKSLADKLRNIFDDVDRQQRQRENLAQAASECMDAYGAVEGLLCNAATNQTDTMHMVNPDQLGTLMRIIRTHYDEADAVELPDVSQDRADVFDILDKEKPDLNIVK